MSDRKEHDKFFQQALANPLIAKEFFEEYLPTEIKQNLRYVIANMLKTLITQQCFIVKHFIISLNSWALYQT